MTSNIDGYCCFLVPHRTNDDYTPRRQITLRDNHTDPQPHVIDTHFLDRLLIRSKTYHLLRTIYGKETTIHVFQSLIEATEIGEAKNVKFGASASKYTTDILQPLLDGVHDHAENENRSSRPSRERRRIDVFSEIERERRMLVLLTVIAQFAETEIQLFQVV